MQDNLINTGTLSHPQIRIYIIDFPLYRIPENYHFFVEDVRYSTTLESVLDYSLNKIKRNGAIHMLFNYQKLYIFIDRNPNISWPLNAFLVLGYDFRLEE